MIIWLVVWVPHNTPAGLAVGPPRHLAHKPRGRKMQSQDITLIISSGQVCP